VPAQLVDIASQLDPGFDATRLPPRSEETHLAMVSPEHFDVVDVRNPFMQGQVGRVDRAAAQEQWRELKASLERDVPVEVVPGEADLVDMVFCQNQTLLGHDAQGRRLCVPAHMCLPGRQAEVPPLVEFFRGQGYRVEDVVPPGVGFEGGGDATWHPGRRLLWGAWGPRSDLAAYGPIAEAYGVPVLRLELVDPRFYHLDTCFLPLDERTVLIYPGAFSEAGQALIAAVFPSVVPVGEAEAAGALALNGVPLPGRRMVMGKGATMLAVLLRELSWSVREVRLGEYLKSGGGAYCMVKRYHGE